MSARGFFITGTDTGVGKTLVSCALLHAFAARGLRVAGMKPVAAGAEIRNGILINEDVEQLIAAGNIDVSRSVVNPYCFEPPIAPHIAAQFAGAEIDCARIVAAYHTLSQVADTVIVEGAGGFCVPLNARQTSADLAVSLALPVVVVVGVRLGCINHALLTMEAISARGLRVAGWVANHIDPHMLRADENVAALCQRIAAPLLARIPFGSAPVAGISAPPFDLEALESCG